MIGMSIYRLDYNEDLGSLRSVHQNNTLQYENMLGWATLCKEISQSQVREFTFNMMEKYGATNPSLKLIKTEFENFLLSDVKI